MPNYNQSYAENLYDDLREQGFSTSEVGYKDNFINAMQDPEKRKKLFGNMQKNGVKNIPSDYDAFESIFTSSPDKYQYDWSTGQFGFEKEKENEEPAPQPLSQQEVMSNIGQTLADTQNTINNIDTQASQIGQTPNRFGNRVQLGVPTQSPLTFDSYQARKQEEERRQELLKLEPEPEKLLDAEEGAEQWANEQLANVAQIQAAQEQEQERRSQPLDPNNPYASPTVGQWEDEVGASVANTIKDFGDKTTKETLDAARKAGDKIWEDYAERNANNPWAFSQGNVVFNTQQSNLTRGQLENLAVDEYKDAVAKIIDSKDFQDRITQDAERLGYDRDFYETKVIDALNSNYLNQLQEELIRQNMPQSDIAYVLAGVQRSIIGGVLSRGSGTLEQWERRETGLQLYEQEHNPNAIARAGNMATGFAVDMPIFGAIGGAASAGVNSAMSALRGARVMRLAAQTGKSVAGVNRAIDAYVNSTLGARIASRVVPNMVQSSTTLGTYNALSTATNQALAGYFDPMEIAKQAGEGAVFGAILGGFSGIGNELSNRVLGSATATSSKIARVFKAGTAEAAKYGTEAAAFTLGEQAGQLIMGEDLKDWDEAIASGVVTPLVLKLSNPAGIRELRKAYDYAFNPKRYNQENYNGVKFDKDEQRRIRESVAGQNFFDALMKAEKMFARDMTPEERGRIMSDPSYYEQRSQLSEAYTDLMNDPNIDFVTKQKLAVLGGGVLAVRMPVATTLDASWDVDTARGEAVLRDAEGRAIESQTFTDERKLNKWVEEKTKVIQAENEAAAGNIEFEPTSWNQTYLDMRRRGMSYERINESQKRIQQYVEAQQTYRQARDTAQQLEAALEEDNKLSKPKLSLEERDQIREAIGQNQGVADGAKASMDAMREQLTPDDQAIMQRWAEYTMERKAKIYERMKAIESKVDDITNNDMGQVVYATLKEGKEKVYVVAGKVASSNNGEIDLNSSDDTVVVADRNGNGKRMVAASDIATVDDVVEPIDEIAEAQRVVEDEIDGELERQAAQPRPAAEETPTEAPTREGEPVFNEGDEIKLNIDGEEQTVTVLSVDGEGNVEVYDPVGDETVTLTPEQLSEYMVREESPEENAPTTEESPATAESALDYVRNRGGYDAMIGEEGGADIAYDAMVEETQGDADMALDVAKDMLKDAEKALEKAKKVTPRAGSTVSEKIKARKEVADDIAEKQAAVDFWNEVVDMPNRRAEQGVTENEPVEQPIEKEQAETELDKSREEDENRKKAREEAEKKRKEQEEKDRINREKVNGVPDVTQDKPEDARTRGYIRVNGQLVERQEPIQTIDGNEVSVAFHKDKAPTKGKVAIANIDDIQQSHKQGRENPLHFFLSDAQPKQEERRDIDSQLSARQIAETLDPARITSTTEAYSGTPSVNARGEVIQGNNRVDALKYMYEHYPDKVEEYKRYLRDHAADYGLTSEDVDKMEKPVLVTKLDVTDKDAVQLGQYKSSDLESGGRENIDAQTTISKMGDKTQTFVRKLLDTDNDEMSITELIRKNGTDVLQWMQRGGYITNAQYRTALNSKGELTEAAMMAMKDVLYETIFKGASSRLREKFDKLPMKAQKALLATMYRDYSSPQDDRLLPEIQKAIEAYYELSMVADFANATTPEDVHAAVELWRRQLNFDENGESYIPSEQFSDFAIRIAEVMKTEKQTYQQSLYNQMFDVIQGTSNDMFFSEDTLDERTQAILKAYRDGKERENTPVSDNAVSNAGEQGSPAVPPEGGEPEIGAGTTEPGRGNEPVEEKPAGETPAEKPKEEEETPIAKGIEEGELTIEDEGYGMLGIYYTAPSGRKVLVRRFPDTEEMRKQAEEQINDRETLKKAVEWFAKKEANEKKAQDFIEANVGKSFTIPGNNADRHAEIVRNEDGEIAIEVTGNGITFTYTVPEIIEESVDDIANGRWKPVEKKPSEVKPSQRIAEIDKEIADIDKQLKENPTDLLEQMELQSRKSELQAERKRLAEENKPTPTEDSKPTDNTQPAEVTDLAGAAGEYRGATIEVEPYTNKRNQTKDFLLVKFPDELSEEERKSLAVLARERKGWRDRERNGYMLRSVDDAHVLIDALHDMREGRTDVVEDNNRGEESKEVKSGDKNDKKVSENEVKDVSLQSKEADKEPVSDEDDELTIEEIDNSDLDPTIKAIAKAYLEGKRDSFTVTTYELAKQYVRSISRNGAGDSSDASGALVGGTVPESGVVADERGGESDRSVDGEGNPGAVPGGERGRNDISVVGMGEPVGGEGDRGVRSGTPPISDGTGTSVSPRPGSKRGGSGNTGTTSRKGLSGRNKVSDTVTEGNNQATDKRNHGQSLIDSALQELDDIFNNPMTLLYSDAGVYSAVPLVAKLGPNGLRIMTAATRLGNGLVEYGYHDFDKWRNETNKRLYPLFKNNTDLSDEEIDRFITELWDAPFVKDGVVRSTREWAEEEKLEALREQAHRSTSERRKLQLERNAQGIEVKLGDIDNIRESLPMLFPNQQEDVQKAEVQFFDITHADKEHGNGKGYLFTNGTGTGKTYTGLGIIRRFLNQGKGRILIVTASDSMIKTWIKSAKDLGITATQLPDTKSKGEGVVVTQYANIRQNYELLKDEFDLIVYDESHKTMENQHGEDTTAAAFHYMLSNRDAEQAILRVMQDTPLWRRGREIEDKVKELLQLLADYDKFNTYELQNRVEQLGGKEGIDNRIKELQAEYKALDNQKKEAVKEALADPEMKEAADKAVARTKVTFLSATPFNTPMNLEYAEGYIFSYPTEEGIERKREDLQGDFIMSNFASSYTRNKRGIVTRLPEQKITDPDAASEEEIAFSNFLQQTLKVMSGRELDSEYDYSREFPQVEFAEKDMFNNAMEGLTNGKYTPLHDYFKTLFDYNTQTAIFEIIKTGPAIERAKEHIAHGRKVVIFHRRLDSKAEIRDPFKSGVEAAKKDENKAIRELAKNFEKDFARLLQWEADLDFSFPQDRVMRAFATSHEIAKYEHERGLWALGGGKGTEPTIKSARVGAINGKETPSARTRVIEEFNKDDSKMDVLVIQVSAGKEGISVHDTTGKHQRAQICIALPQSPIEFIQMEGRIYRIGNKSDAIFEYPFLGVDAELTAFSSKINGRSQTTENLALGDKSRGLRDSIARAALASRVIPVQAVMGKGGKALDDRSLLSATGYDTAISNYGEWANESVNDGLPFGQRDVPDPIGYKMAEWGASENGETVFIPDAGNGTVARYVSGKSRLWATEPKSNRFARLVTLVGGGGRKVENVLTSSISRGEADVCITRAEQLEKVLKIAESSGRVVVLAKESELPECNKTMEEHDKGYWHSNKVAEIILPSLAMDSDGEKTHIIVYDLKYDKNAKFNTTSPQMTDLSNITDRDKLFETLRMVQVPARDIDKQERIQKHVSKHVPKMKNIPFLAKSKSYRTKKMEPDIYNNRTHLLLTFKSGTLTPPIVLSSGEISNRYRCFEISYEPIANNDADYIVSLAKTWIMYNDYVNGSRPIKEIIRYNIEEENKAAVRDACVMFRDAIATALGKNEMQIRNIANGVTENRVSGTMTIDQFKQVFDGLNNESAEQKDLAERVFLTASKLEGIEVKVVAQADMPNPNVIGLYTVRKGKSALWISDEKFNSIKYSDEVKAATITHELIHAITTYFINSYSNGNTSWMSDEQKEACRDILDSYKAINTDEFRSRLRLNSKAEDNAEYGLTNEYEMMAEMSNPAFRSELKKKKVWRQLVNGTKKILGIDVTGEDDSETNVYDVLNHALEVLMNNYDNEEYQNFVGQYASSHPLEVSATLRDKEDVVRDLADELGLASVETIEDVSKLPKNQRTKKGLYNTRTGKITIILPNNNSIADVEHTVLHEGVVHYGLRQMFGNNFDKFLDDVFSGVDETTRAKIVDKARTNGWNFHRATEEYLGDMSDSMGWQEKPSLWRRIKNWFLEMLRRCGFSRFLRLSDNDLRYYLWRSRENLRGRRRGVVETAEDIDKQRELGVGDFEEDGTSIFRSITREGRQLNEREAEELLAQMEEHAEVAPTLELTPETWEKEFGKGNRVNTPIGEVKLGENQYKKLVKKKRTLYFGMIKPTLERPDVILEEYDPQESAERDTKYLFVKTFTKPDGGRVVHFESVTVKKEGLEVSISSHELPADEVKEKMQNDNILHLNSKLPFSSEWPLTKAPQGEGPDLVPTSDNSSRGKGNNTSETSKGNEENNAGELLYRPGDSEEVAERGNEEAVEKAMSKAVTEQKKAAATLKALAKVKEDNANRAAYHDRAVRQIGASMLSLRQAMAQQRQFDSESVGVLSQLAKQMIDAGLIAEPSQREIKRLLSTFPSGVRNMNKQGQAAFAKTVNNLFDIMAANQWRQAQTAFDKALSTKGYTTKSGPKRAVLDDRGNALLDELRASLNDRRNGLAAGIDRDVITMRQWQYGNDVAENDGDMKATGRYEAMSLLGDYYDNVLRRFTEEADMRREIEETEAARKAGEIDADTARETIASLEDAIRESSLERAAALGDVTQRLHESLAESKGAINEWQAMQNKRKSDIIRDANADGKRGDKPISTAVQNRPTTMQRVVNSELVQFFTSALPTFDMLFRMYGHNNINGEGRLWRRFTRQYTEASDKQYKEWRAATDELNAKVAEVYGKKGLKWSDMFTTSRKDGNVSVYIYDGNAKDAEGKPLKQEKKLSQGSLAYIYMVNKMTDGKMKLRRMGISEEDVEKIVASLDPRLVELADWLQTDFFPELMERYNVTHRQVFGVSMEDIPNYAPLKIQKRAIPHEEDMTAISPNDKLPSTMTGSIIQRTRNTLPIDILNADMFGVVADHVRDMSHWMAFAQMNKDLCTLLSFKKFRNQTFNMTTIMGGGDRLWERVKTACIIASGNYTPEGNRGGVDAIVTNVAKGATSAQIALRFYTAFKQLASGTAGIHNSNWVELTKAFANPVGSWRWAMRELPGFSKRWMSRIAGETRLLPTESDWGFWRTNTIQRLQRAGMAANASVDCLTVACMARATYNTKYKQYINEGYSQEDADRMAKSDAAVSYNETQQSTENLYVTRLQLDNTVTSVALSVFNNAPFGYGRQTLLALSNLSKMLTPGYRAQSLAYMARQHEKQGLDEEEAQRAAEKEYRKAWGRNIIAAANFAVLLPALWQLFSFLPQYLVRKWLGGDDEDKNTINDITTYGLCHSVDGLVLGKYLGDLAYGVAREGSIPYYYDNSMLPMLENLESVIGEIGTDRWVALNDAVNLVAMCSAGYNIETLQSMVEGIYNACGQDEFTTRDAALMVMSVLNVPKSQRDNVYFDELGLSAKDAEMLTPKEIAERYALQKAKHDAGWTWFLHSEEAKDTALDRAMKNANKKAKERAGRYMYEDVRKQFEEYDNEYKELKRKKDLTREERRKVAIGNAFDNAFNKVAKVWLTTDDPARVEATQARLVMLRNRFVQKWQDPDATFEDTKKELDEINAWLKGINEKK